MPRVVLQSWCLAVLCSVMASALYLPELSNRLPQLTNIVHSLDTSRTSPQPRIVKRASGGYNGFYRLMSRQRPRYRDDRIFVDQMFTLFDLNSDQTIDKAEFKAILQLMGLANHIEVY